MYSVVGIPTELYCLCLRGADTEYFSTSKRVHHMVIRHAAGELVYIRVLDQEADHFIECVTSRAAEIDSTNRDINTVNIKIKLACRFPD
jgi:hypothetical protein